MCVNADLNLKTYIQLYLIHVLLYLLILIQDNRAKCENVFWRFLTWLLGGAFFIHTHNLHSFKSFKFIHGWLVMLMIDPDNNISIVLV